MPEPGPSPEASSERAGGPGLSLAGGVSGDGASPEAGSDPACGPAPEGWGSAGVSGAAGGSGVLSAGGGAGPFLLSSCPPSSFLLSSAGEVRSAGAPPCLSPPCLPPSCPSPACSSRPDRGSAGGSESRVGCPEPREESGSWDGSESRDDPESRVGSPEASSEAGRQRRSTTGAASPASGAMVSLASASDMAWGGAVEDRRGYTASSAIVWSIWPMRSSARLAVICRQDSWPPTVSWPSR